MYILGDRLRLHAFEHLESLPGRIDNHPTVGALIHVLFQVLAQGAVDRLVQVVVQPLEKFLTGKQKRRLLSAGRIGSIFRGVPAGRAEAGF